MSLSKSNPIEDEPEGLCTEKMQAKEVADT
jgi:hypothetical protein